MFSGAACAHMRAARMTQLVSLRSFRRPCCVALSEQAQGADFVGKVSVADMNDQAKGKLRLDAFLCARLPDASRARLQASIKQGLVLVNGRPSVKPSLLVKPGDMVAASVLAPPPLEAAPEAGLPLEIVFEDEHLIVVNKAAGMVMHPSPGHYSGTLVNALLHHCGLPAMRLAHDTPAPVSLAAVAAAELGAATPGSNGRSSSGGHGSAEAEAEADDGSDFLSDDDADDEEGGGTRLVLPPDAAAAAAAAATGGQTAAAAAAAGVIRPGIVHRLDRGTTGLLVVAKTDAAHASLAAQFKSREVSRAYLAVTLGVPSPAEGRVATNVGRDLRDRKKMAAFAYGSARGRTAASNYRVLELLAGGTAALVQWRLETGRTHQIRVHAKHLGHPLIGDEAYGGGPTTAGAALAAARRSPAARAAASAAAAVAARELGRPALHAATLGFRHPSTGEGLMFESSLPADFEALLSALRSPPLA